MHKTDTSDILERILQFKKVKKMADIYNNFETSFQQVEALQSSNHRRCIQADLPTDRSCYIVL